MAGLLRRLGNVIEAGAHDALDGLESPDASLRQLVRRATDDIARVRALAVEAIAAEKRLGQEVDRHGAAATELHREAATALHSGDEEGARDALARRREHLSALDALSPQHATAAENGATLKRRLGELERSLGRLKNRRDGIAARRKGAEALHRADATAREMLSEHEIVERLSRAEETVADFEARNAAAAEIDRDLHPSGGSVAVAAAVERELEALRASER